MSIEDFEFQLRAQQQSAAEKSGNSASLKTYVDPTDGTVYEWDSEKQGWFPKVFQIMRTITVSACIDSCL